MLAGLVVTTVVSVVGFGLILLVLYAAKAWQLRRLTVSGARIQTRSAGIGAVALLMGTMWACMCGALALAVHIDIAGFLGAIGVVVVISALRPLFAKGGPPFVIAISGSGQADIGEAAGTRRSSGADGARAAGRRQDVEVHAEHREALARGEERVLRQTVAGTLHSYRPDEHVPAADDPYNLVSLGPGLFIAAIYLGFAVLSLVIFFTGNAGDFPEWLLPVGAVAFIYFGRPAFVFCRDEYRASRIRKTRGVPQPGRGKGPRAASSSDPENDRGAG
ncbi:hypothetical protein BN1051_00114 [Arthrobacter saudimassiliensis]|uniref:Uncharacterized protein n=1 Tax=Arthrobacter saudimassiliensis TaxID=1461584 RepID=A0A078MMW8_9MICC|nr:hypothetical protein BN1051_00114 [Arthrobacter saudimassiliensis]